MALDRFVAQASRRGRAAAIVGVIGLILVSGSPEPPAQAQGRASAAVVIAAAHVSVSPTSGPGGTRVRVKGAGFNATDPCGIGIFFTDANGVNTGLKGLPASSSFKTKVKTPKGAAAGSGSITARQFRPLLPPPNPIRCYVVYAQASAPFTVTSSGGARWVR